jgi:hypothetical protein
MAYDVTKTDGTRLTILADRTVDVTTPIKLIGKNYAGYGEIMAENLVQMLENFSSFIYGFCFLYPLFMSWVWVCRLRFRPHMATALPT